MPERAIVYKFKKDDLRLGCSVDQWHLQEL